MANMLEWMKTLGAQTWNKLHNRTFKPCLKTESTKLFYWEHWHVRALTEQIQSIQTPHCTQQYLSMHWMKHSHNVTSRVTAVQSLNLIQRIQWIVSQLTMSSYDISIYMQTTGYETNGHSSTDPKVLKQISISQLRIWFIKPVYFSLNRNCARNILALNPEQENVFNSRIHTFCTSQVHYYLVTINFLV